MRRWKKKKWMMAGVGFRAELMTCIVLREDKSLQ